MNSNTAVVNEMEQKDIICDYPDDCTQDQQDEKIMGDDDNFLKIVAEHVEIDPEIEQEDNPAEQEINNITVEASLLDSRKFSLW